MYVCISTSLFANDSILPSFLGGTKERQRGRSKDCFSKNKKLVVGPRSTHGPATRSTVHHPPPTTRPRSSIVSAQARPGGICERNAKRSEEERGRHRERDRERYHASRRCRRGQLRLIIWQRKLLTATASELVAAGGSCGRGVAVELAAVRRYAGAVFAVEVAAANVEAVGRGNGCRGSGGRVCGGRVGGCRQRR